MLHCHTRLNTLKSFRGRNKVVVLGMWRLLLILVLGVGVAGTYTYKFGAPDIVRDQLPPEVLQWVDKLEAMGAAASESNEDTTSVDAESTTSEEAVGVDPQPSEHAGLSSNAALRMNERGLQIIKDSEGLRLEAYSAGGRDYIGYGHQMAPGEPRVITEAQADELLRKDVMIAEDGVRRLLTRTANENQFSAMVSLAYNLGTARFASRSQVLVKFNAGDIQGAANAFRDHNRGGGEILPHLVERREKERMLFLAPA